MVSTPNDGRYRGKHDPYNSMEEASIRPENIARQELSAAEQAATKNGSDSISRGQKTPFGSNRITRSLQQSEQNQKSGLGNQFRNSVAGRALKESGKRKGFLKKAAPLTMIVGVLFGGGAFFYGAQSLLAPHLSALYTNATDLQFTSYNMRNSRLMSYMIDGGGQVKITGFTTKYSTFSPYLKKRLASNGIEVGHLDSNGAFQSGQFGGKTVLKYEDKIIDAGSFQNEFANNANFRDAYYQAKRGRIAGFFDNSADYYYKKKGATRDIFNSYKSTGDNEVDTKNFETTVSERVTGSDASLNTVRHETDEETGEDHIRENGDDIDTNRVQGSTPESKARAMVNNIAGKVSSIGIPVCSALRIANIAAVTVASYQIYQSIAYFLSLMEPVSKMMAGEGDAAAINETLNFMTTATDQEVSYVDSDGKQQTKTVHGSLLESAGSKLVLGNTLSPKEAVEPYSFDNITRAATAIAVSTGVTNTACAGVMAASAIVSLSATAIPGGKLATFIVGAIAQTVGGIVLTGVVAAIVSAIIPYVAKIFASNIFETYTGIPAGELFSQGAATANFSLATQASAYMPADKDAVKTQNRSTTLALAQEAEVDRLHRSPFDASSPNTFLGSLMSNFTYLSYSNNAVSSFAGLFNSFGKSVRKLTSVSAADEELTYTSNYQECTFLEGATCDMYGLPIPASDYSTIDVSPDDPTYIAVIRKNLDSNGEIKEGSELGKFINFCANRQSPWGVKDANILNALQTDFGIVGNNLPVVNDIVDVVNAAEDVANEGWATGSTCMNSKDNPRWDTEFKYYQRYIEDMRILSSMEGSNDASASASGGLTDDLAQKIVEHFKNPANDSKWTASLRKWNCVSLSTYFVQLFTDIDGKSVLNGGNKKGCISCYNGVGVADGLASYGVSVGTEPRPFSIFSVSGPSAYASGGAGHTGVVLAVNGNDLTIIEAGWGAEGYAAVRHYNLNQMQNRKFAYLEDHMDWDALSQAVGVNVSNTVSASEPTTPTVDNPVIAYLKDHDEKHPEDNSFEGVLARISGQTKEDVAMMLEFVDYSTKIANYDPSTRYDFGLTSEPTQISFSSDETQFTTIATTLPKLEKIFIDKRNYLV